MYNNSYKTFLGRHNNYKILLQNKPQGGPSLIKKKLIDWSHWNLSICNAEKN